MSAWRHKGRLGFFGIGLLLGALSIALVWAADLGSGEVRVAVRVHESGQVEVAVQQRTPGDPGASTPDAIAGGWGERQLPQFRFVPADADHDTWYVSDGVQFEATEPDPTSVGEAGVTNLGPFQIIGTPTGNRPLEDDALLCIVTHGEQADFFWFQVYSAFADAMRWYDLDIRTEMRRDSADQARAISECVEDGAVALATTLADVETLQPALLAAGEAGVRLVTFNSGGDHATDTGSTIHVGIDERAVGRIAAEQLIERGVEGDVLCIIHEESNVGLEQRCDSLETTYTAGETIRLRIHDAAKPQEAIVAAVTDETGAILALNANTGFEVADALSAERPDVILAAVSSDFPEPLAMLYSGRLSFVLWSHALEQGYLTTTALRYAYGTPFPRETGLFQSATQILIQPTVVTQEAIRNLYDSDNFLKSNLPQWIDALDKAIQREQAASEPGG